MSRDRVDLCQFGYALAFDAPALPQVGSCLGDHHRLQHALGWFGLAPERQCERADTRLVPCFDGRATVTIRSAQLETVVRLRGWAEIYFMPVLLECVVLCFVGDALRRPDVVTTVTYAARLRVSECESRAIRERHFARGDASTVTYRSSDYAHGTASEEGWVTLSACGDDTVSFGCSIGCVIRSPLTPIRALERSEQHVQACGKWLGFQPPAW